MQSSSTRHIVCGCRTAFPCRGSLRIRQDVAPLTRRLYNYAARDVPLPADPGLRDVRADDARDRQRRRRPGRCSARIQAQYDRWLTARDRVASAWFGRLYRRYRRLTFYPLSHRS